MTKMLIKMFVKEYESTEKASVRTAYGVMASVVGVVCNLLLFCIKGGIGLVLQSVSVTADAFNNLSDAGSSILSVLGVKMAEKPADREHPFGHGRVEYIAAFVMAFLVMQVGFSFFKDALAKIQNPQVMQFRLVLVIILILTILVKIWLALFYKKIGKSIDSQMFKAVAADAMSDVLVTSSTIISLFTWEITGMNIDGWIGVVVALGVIWAGVSIAKDTIEPLLGEAVSMETYQMLTKFVENYEGIIGSHDLIVHNYGPGRSMASIHAEVPNDADIEYSHEIIDKIEREAKEKLDIFLVIHMDPIETKNEVVIQTKSTVENVVLNLHHEMSIHDFRMVEGKEQVNLIFDLIIPHDYSEIQKENAKKNIQVQMQAYDEKYQCVITAEKSFIAQDE